MCSALHRLVTLETVLSLSVACAIVVNEPAGGHLEIGLGSAISLRVARVEFILGICSPL